MDNSTSLLNAAITVVLVKARVSIGAVGATLALLLLAGCNAQPEPTPTATGFVSEAEAFAAAEETYRAYVDALNEVDLSDPETFEPVYEWTTGDADASSRESFSRMHADGWTVRGKTQFDSFTPVVFSEDDEPTVAADICLDVTDVTVEDEEGISVVPETRANRQPIRVDFETAPTVTGLRVAQSTALDSPLCTS